MRELAATPSKLRWIVARVFREFTLRCCGCATVAVRLIRAIQSLPAWGGSARDSPSWINSRNAKEFIARRWSNAAIARFKPPDRTSKSWNSFWRSLIRLGLEII